MAHACPKVTTPPFVHTYQLQLTDASVTSQRNLQINNITQASIDIWVNIVQILFRISAICSLLLPENRECKGNGQQTLKGQLSSCLILTHYPVSDLQK